MKKLLKRFTSQFTGSKITEVAQFEPFKQTIDKIVGTSAQTLEEKVVSLLVCHDLE